MKVKSLILFRFLTTWWTVAYQAPPSMGFSMQAYWSSCHFLLQRIFPTQDQTWVSHIADRCFNLWATREEKKVTKIKMKKSKMHLNCGTEKRNNNNMGRYLPKKLYMLKFKTLKSGIFKLQNHNEFQTSTYKKWRLRFMEMIVKIII